MPLARRVQRFVVNAGNIGQVERSLGTAELRIAHHPAHAVAGNIELRHHANAARPRIRHHLAHLLLGIELAVRAETGQLRIDLAFRAEALVVAQVPVKDIQLHHRHAVQRALDLLHRLEVAAHIDHQAAPLEARRVLNTHCGNGRRVLFQLHQLQQRLHAMKRADDRRGPAA